MVPTIRARDPAFYGSRYQKRHYEDVAKVLKEANKGGDNRTVGSITHHFATIFKADNQSFDRARFLKACGFDATFCPEE